MIISFSSDLNSSALPGTRKAFSVGDAYGVEVSPGQDDALLLAVAVCLDRIHHGEQECR